MVTFWRIRNVRSRWCSRQYKDGNVRTSGMASAPSANELVRFYKGFRQSAHPEYVPNASWLCSVEWTYEKEHGYCPFTTIKPWYIFTRPWKYPSIHPFKPQTAGCLLDHSQWKVNLLKLKIQFKQLALFHFKFSKMLKLSEKKYPRWQME